MFESDDYDQVLSQLDFPESSENIQPIAIDLQNIDNKVVCPSTKSPKLNTSLNGMICKQQDSLFKIPYTPNNILKSISNSDHTQPDGQIKRKILNTYFDHKSKRKFPGPAGLLTGSFEDKQDESICQVELLSQDVNFTQNYVHEDILETPLWKRVLEDTKDISKINNIRAIKDQALAGNLHKKKAQNVKAFVESVDRSVIDPLIKLRDNTGHINCTLHRDAWTSFSSYIVAEYCGLVICKPTVLTTGSAYKKHYLNITLSNIWAIYSSAILSDDESVPDGFTKICEDSYTIIKSNSKSDINLSPENSLHESFEVLDDLDGVFLDDEF